MSSLGLPSARKNIEQWSKSSEGRASPAKDMQDIQGDGQGNVEQAELDEVGGSWAGLIIVCEDLI